MSAPPASQTPVIQLGIEFAPGSRVQNRAAPSSPSPDASRISSASGSGKGHAYIRCRRLPVGAEILGSATGRTSDQRMVHCWLLCPLHVHRMSLVPFTVPLLLASRHSPDCTPVIVPLALTVHCWLAWPLQSQMITAVPLVVPWLFASRHLAPP